MKHEETMKEPGLETRLEPLIPFHLVLLPPFHFQIPFHRVQYMYIAK
jgi:hypothetical protein